MTRKHIPIRMCSICKCRDIKYVLKRYIFAPEKNIFQYDKKQLFPGKGWYVCLKETCEKNFRTYIPNFRKRRRD